MDIRQIHEGLWCIDLEFGGGREVIASYLVSDGNKYALIETGPSSTLQTLEAGVNAIGIRLADVSKLIVTHIHLDHAGATGTLVRRYPHMQIYVHEIGAPHLQDPSKLLLSATRIYGDRMQDLWGEVLPVPADRLTPVRDGDTVTVGTLELDVMYTPGHASHHVAFVDRRRSEAFTGDVAAIRLPGFDHVRPATPPPDIDLEVWDESLDRLKSRRLNTIYLTHFGPFADVAAHLTKTSAQLTAWARYIDDLRRSSASVPDMKAALQAHGEAEIRRDGGDSEAVRRYDLAAPTWMSVDGLLRYFLKRSP